MEKITAQLKEKDMQFVKAAMGDKSNYTADEVLSIVNNNLDYFYRRLENFYTMFYEYVDKHNQGHLPKITSRKRMEDALDVLKMDSEYEPAPKKVVYASLNGKTDAIIQ